MSSVRTPDPNPGWLSEDDLNRARATLPIVYVQAIPVRLDPLGCLSEIGLLLTANDEGRMVRTFVSGRVMYRETVRAALLRHLEKDLGPLAMPQMPSTTVPFAVSEFFPSPSETGLTDDRQHAVALSYIIPVRGECEPRQDAPAVLDDPGRGAVPGRPGGVRGRARGPHPSGDRPRRLGALSVSAALEGRRCHARAVTCSGCLALSTRSKVASLAPAWLASMTRYSSVT